MEVKNKIIFLDIDGVLNGYNRLTYLGWRVARILHLSDWYRKHTRDVFGIHEEKVKRLAKIVHVTGAKVVLSSSWRTGVWKTPYEEMTEDGKDLVDLFKKYSIEIIDITPYDCKGRRDREILAWLSRNENRVDKYIIIDDEVSILQCFDKELVQTSNVKRGQMIQGHAYENTGLKRKHIKMAIERLS